MPRKSKPKKPEADCFLIGVALDNEDGHQRITKGEEFVLLGGSQESHERLQDIAIHITEALQSKGKRLQDTCVEEVIELVQKAREAQG